MEDLLSWLQDTFVSLCDGDWEHGRGFRIVSLDNPGWSLEVDLLGTKLEGQPFSELKREIDKDDWMFCRVRDNVFEGYGGPYKLKAILQTFHEWYDSINP